MTDYIVILSAAKNQKEKTLRCVAPQDDMGKNLSF
jgi:hypothetical protein